MARPSLSFIKTHVFRGMKFRIEWKRPPRPKKLPKGEEMHGSCSLADRLIRINPDPDSLELLFTTLHESLHACFFDLEDGVIDDWEDAAKRLVRRMGIKVTFEGKP